MKAQLRLQKPKEHVSEKNEFKVISETRISLHFI